jgi:hypothetical protein
MVSGEKAPSPPPRISGKRVGPVLRFDGDAAQIEHAEDIRVVDLMLERKADDVEFAEGAAGLEREKRDGVLAQHRVEIGPGREGALGRPARMPIDAFIQQVIAVIRHAEVVDVGKGQAAAHADRLVGLDGHVELAAQVTGGLFNAKQKRLDVFDPDSHERFPVGDEARTGLPPGPDET